MNKKLLLLLLIALSLVGCSNNVELDNNSCESKKFSKQYTYVYETMEECTSKGLDNYNYVYDEINKNVTSYGCEEIIDDCGEKFYGVYFNIWVGLDNDNYFKWYY